MPRVEFFTSLGFFAIRNFLDPEVCLRLQSEMKVAEGFPAQVTDKATDQVDEDYRRTRRAIVSAEAVAFLEERLIALKPALEEHFRLTLSACEKPQFLVYRTGDFFRRHEDNTTEPEAPEYLRRRRVSAVAFLNAEAQHPVEGCYCGGPLAFYELMGDPRMKAYGFPLVGEPGLLVAFRSAITHEVQPVTYGERYTAVSWFY